TNQIIANNFTQIYNYSKPIKSVKQKQKDHTKSIEINSSIDLNSTYAGPL
ncbi:40651_t:CDS:2, partial [Gigaspora margarita]